MLSTTTSSLFTITFSGLAFGSIRITSYNVCYTKLLRCGYDVVFVGSNTPFEDFYNAVGTIKPDVIAISVSNYYNLVVTKKIIDDIRKKTKNEVKIIVGGYAFSENLEKVKMVGADYYAQTFDDIKSISEEVKI